MKVQVRSGDTLWYYSQLFMLPFNLLVDSNPTVNPSALSIGQQINIPGFIAQDYSLSTGDTFWKLSKGRHLSVDALFLLNQTVNPNQLQVGMKISLPNRVISPVVNGKRKYDFKALEEDIQKLKDVYSYLDINTIGKTVMEKPIQVIKLGKGTKKVHINASFHANEWITSGVLMALLNHFLLSLTNVKPIRGLDSMSLYDQVELSIVPMLNPDGVDLVINGPGDKDRERVVRINRGSTDFSGWKANIRGVDLNKQFPAKWEVEKERMEKVPSPRDYPGAAPLTEPESITMANLARDNQFNRMLAFHTQGEELYWGYEGLEPPESKLLADEFARVSGYNAIQYVDNFAGHKDWFIKEFRKPGFTIELGKGINPLPLTQFDEIFEEVLGIFLASLYM